MNLLQLAVERGLISPAQASQALEAQQAGESLARTLLRLELLEGPRVSQLELELGTPDTLVSDRPAEARGESDRVLPVESPRYQIGSLLGQGGMGEVHRAHDPQLRREVALKRIRQATPGLQARFVEEAQVTAQLDHPNIVPIYELGQDDSGPYFTMKEVRGRTLSAVIASGETRLPGLLRIFLKICDAIGFAHNRGVIHRDLKPDNVMVGEFGEVLVMDWGLAKLTKQAEGAPVTSTRGEDDAMCTGAGGVAGTLAYMPPEQLGDGAALDPRADQFALGGVLFEMLTGTPPRLFCSGAGLPETKNHVRKVAIPAARVRAPGREIPAELEAVCAKALALQTDRRYVSVSELAADVRAFLDGRLVEAAQYSMGALLRNWLARHPNLVRVAVAVAITASLFGGLLIQRQSDERGRRQARVDAARQAVEAQGPASIQTDAKRLLEESHARSAAVLQPGAASRERTRALLVRLQRLADRRSALLRLAPEDRTARHRLYDSLVLLGEVARVGQDYTLAQFAFSQAASLGIADVDARALGSVAAGAERALSQAHRLRIERLLDAAAANAMEGEQAYRAALIEISSYRERQTIDLLLPRLERIVRLLRRVTETMLLGANELQQDEQQIPGLRAQVARWMASQQGLPAGREQADLPPSVMASIRLASRRLEQRERRARSGAARSRSPAWQAILGRAQRVALSAAGKSRGRLLQLICESLGQLGEARGVVLLLERYLWSEWDQQRAVTAGIALGRLQRRDPHARTVLHDMVGLRSPQRRPARWDLDGHWWRNVTRVRRQLSPTRKAAPTSPTASAREALSRGLALAAEGKAQAALGCYSRSIALDSKFLRSWNARGRLRLELSDFSGSIADFRRAIELGPRVPGAHNNLGIALSASGDYPGAVAAYTRAVKLDPRYSQAWSNRGNAHKAAGKLDLALADYSHSIGLRPDLPEGYNNRGLIRLLRNDPKRALADFTKALSLDPGSPGLRFNRGNARMVLGNLDGALRDYTQVIAAQPRHHLALRARAKVLRLQGDLLGAIRDCTRALKIKPGDHKSLTIRGSARQDRGDRDGAMRDFSAAIRQAPKYALAYFNRALARRKGKDLSGALADFDMAIKLDPRNLQARNNRGMMRRKSRDFVGAEADFRAVLAIQPRFWQGWGNLALVLRDLNQQQAAIAAMRKAQGLAPKKYQQSLKRLMDWIKR